MKEHQVSNYFGMLNDLSGKTDANKILRGGQLFPRSDRPTKRRKKPATNTNELTDEVIRHIKSRGGVAYRINSQGQYDPVKNRWRPSGMKKGLPDVFGILKGTFCGVEIKTGRDKLSEYQLQRKAEIEAAGGHFFVASDLETFKREFNNLFEQV